MNNRPHRYRLSFEKTSELRYTGHLDLHRALERTFRRAGLPLAYSQGFNPKPRINIGAALPLGMTSICELADFWLEEKLLPDDLFGKLSDHGPPGLTVRSISEVEATEPSLQNQIAAAEYKVTASWQPDDSLREEISTLLGKPEILRQRRAKTYDLRPLILGLSIDSSDEHSPTIWMRLSASEGKTGRPDEVCLELGLDPGVCSIQRVRILFEGELELVG